jgi:hypothetical protein
MSASNRKLSTIQLSQPAINKMKKKKKDYETYEEYLRRIGVI